MKLKRVSFKIALAIKDIGYPQGDSDSFYINTDDYFFYKKGELVKDNRDNYYKDDIIDAPYAMEVYLWLWREKKEILELLYYPIRNKWCILYNCNQEMSRVNDIEEAIIATLEYLVNNNLIK